MSAAYISTQDYPSLQYIEFNIEAAKDGKNKDLAAIYNSFTTLQTSPMESWLNGATMVNCGILAQAIQSQEE